MSEHHVSEPPRARRPGAFTGRGSCERLVRVADIDYYHLYRDPSCNIVAARRTSVPFWTPEDVADCFQRVEALLAPIDRGAHRLLVDMRRGPSRNDPTFEAAFREHRPRLVAGFARNAVVTATEVGGLQVQRYARDDGRSVFTTDSPRAAFEYLGVPPHPW